MKTTLGEINKIIAGLPSISEFFATPDTIIFYKIYDLQSPIGIVGPPLLLPNSARTGTRVELVPYDSFEYIAGKGGKEVFSKEVDGLIVVASDAGFFLAKSESGINKVLAYIPIYEPHFFTKMGDVVTFVGHEEAVTIDLRTGHFKHKYTR